MSTFAVTRSSFVAALVAGAVCVTLMTVGSGPFEHYCFEHSGMPVPLKQKNLAPLSNQISATSAHDSLRTTELPNHYSLVEEIDFESDIPSSFNLIKNGKIVLKVTEPVFSRVFATDRHNDKLPIPQLLFMTQESSGGQCVNRLSVISLPADAAPKFVLKNVPTWQAPTGRFEIDVDDLKLGVNTQPGSTTVDSSWPKVMLAWNGQTYVASADSMRWNDMYGIHDLLRLYSKTLRHSYDKSPDRKSAPLTPMVIDRIYELIYYGNAEDARKLLDLAYPRTRYLQVHLPFEHYFGCHAMASDPQPMRLLTKAEVWQEMIRYLRNNTAYLPTLKELNPGLFK